jgi:hypothetical protein
MTNYFTADIKKEDELWVVHLFEAQEPSMCLYCAPWYDAEDDDGELAMTAICLLYQYAHRQPLGEV